MTPDSSFGGLVDWERATGMVVPRPPGPPEAWTCLLAVLGPFRTFARWPVDVPVVDRGTLRAWLEVLGRPVHGAEQVPWLLATPVVATDPEGVLLQLLGHADGSVRAGAARVLGSGGHPRAAASLTGLLRGPTDEERVAAALGLARCGGPDAVVELLEDDGRPEVSGARLEAVAAMARAHGWHVVDPHLDGAGDVRRLVRAVRKGDRDALRPALRGNEDLRNGVASCVAAYPDLAVALAGELARQLEQQPGVDSQRGVVGALGAAGEEGVELAEDLLAHESWQVRTAGAMALQEAGVAARPAVKALRQALTDADADVQREAALALQLAGHDPERMAARMARRVVRTHGFVERVRRLGGSLGPFDALLHDCAPSLELLAQLASPHDPDMAAVGALWLGHQAGPMCAPVLAHMAVDRQRRVPLTLRRGAAAGTFLAGGPPAAGGVVHRLLLAHDPQAVGLGVDGSRLGAWGGELAAVALSDPDAHVRWSAVRALRGLGAEAEPYLPVLAQVGRTDPAAVVRDDARNASPQTWRGEGVGHRFVDVLHAHADRPGAGGPSLLALAVGEPEVAFDLAQGLLDHDQRPLAVAAARVVGRVARQTPDDASAWCREGLRRLSDAQWRCREVGAVLLHALAGAPLSAALSDEAAEVLQATRDDSDDDVRVAIESALRAWERA